MRLIHIFAALLFTDAALSSDLSDDDQSSTSNHGVNAYVGPFDSHHCTCDVQTQLQEIWHRVFGDDPPRTNVYTTMSLHQLRQLESTGSCCIRGTNDQGMIKSSPIPSNLGVAGIYQYMKDHLPVVNFSPLWDLILDLDAVAVSDRFAFVLSQERYLFTSNKLKNKECLQKFTEGLNKKMQTMQALFDDKSELAKSRYPEIDTFLERLLEEQETVFPLQKTECNKASSRSLGARRELFNLNASICQFNSHLLLFSKHAKRLRPGMIVEILKQVIMRLDIRDIPGAVNIYSRLLKEITQIKPLIEPETAMLAIQHDGGIQSIVRLFD